MSLLSKKSKQQQEQQQPYERRNMEETSSASAASSSPIPVTEDEPDNNNDNDVKKEETVSMSTNNQDDYDDNNNATTDPQNQQQPPAAANHQLSYVTVPSSQIMGPPSVLSESAASTTKPPPDPPSVIDHQIMDDDDDDDFSLDNDDDDDDDNDDEDNEQQQQHWAHPQSSPSSLPLSRSRLDRHGDASVLQKALSYVIDVPANVDIISSSYHQQNQNGDAAAAVVKQDSSVQQDTSSTTVPEQSPQDTLLENSECLEPPAVLQQSTSVTDLPQLTQAFAEVLQHDEQFLSQQTPDSILAQAAAAAAPLSRGATAPSSSSAATVSPPPPLQNGGIHWALSGQPAAEDTFLSRPPPQEPPALSPDHNLLQRQSSQKEHQQQQQQQQQQHQQQSRQHQQQNTDHRIEEMQQQIQQMQQVQQQQQFSHHAQEHATPIAAHNNNGKTFGRTTSAPTEFVAVPQTAVASTATSTASASAMDFWQDAAQSIASPQQLQHSQLQNQSPPPPPPPPPPPLALSESQQQQQPQPQRALSMPQDESHAHAHHPLPAAPSMATTSGVQDGNSRILDDNISLAPAASGFMVQSQQHQQQQQQQHAAQQQQRPSTVPYAVSTADMASANNGRRKIHLRLLEEVLQQPEKQHTRRASFLGHFRSKSDKLMNQDQPQDPQQAEWTTIDRGTLSVSWFPGTSSLELQEHVRKSVWHKLRLSSKTQLVDFRILDETEDPPEEIVLSTHIPHGSKFTLRFTLASEGTSTPKQTVVRPPESPSAAPAYQMAGLSNQQMDDLTKQLDELRNPSTRGEKSRSGKRSKKHALRPRKSDYFQNARQNEHHDDDASTSDEEGVSSADTMDPIEARLHEITKLLLDDRERKHAARQEKRQVVFGLVNYFVFFLGLIAIMAELQARAPEWLSSMEQQLKDVRDCSADQEALFECVQRGDFAGLVASVILWLSRSVIPRRIFLFGFESPKKLWTVVYESFVTAFCWGFSYIFIRRGLNTDTRERFLQKYWKDAVYGSLAGFNAAFMKHVLKNLIPQEAVEVALRDRQLKFLSWLPSFE